MSASVSNRAGFGSTAGGGGGGGAGESKSSMVRRLYGGRVLPLGGLTRCAVLSGFVTRAGPLTGGGGAGAGEGLSLTMSFLCIGVSFLWRASMADTADSRVMRWHLQTRHGKTDCTVARFYLTSQLGREVNNGSEKNGKAMRSYEVRSNELEDG